MIARVTLEIFSTTLTHLDISNLLHFTEWNICEKRVVTKVGPGSVKVVCKSKKTGKVWDYTMCFTDRGCVIKTCVDGAECTEHYK